MLEKRLLCSVLGWQFHPDSFRRRMAVGMTISDLNITEFLVRCKVLFIELFIFI